MDEKQKEENEKFHEEQRERDEAAERAQTDLTVEEICDYEPDEEGDDND